MAQEQARNTGVEWSRRGLMTLQRAAVDGLVRGQNLITNQINNNQQTSSPQPSPQEPSPTSPPSTGLQAYLPGRMLPENLLSRFYSSTSSTSSTSSSTSSTSSQSSAQSNTLSSDVYDSEDTIYDALPVDVQNYSLHDQEAYIFQQRKQLERMLRTLDVAETELTQRTRLSRSASDSATRRRHRKNNNHARRSLMVTEEDEEREFDFERIERFNGGEDMSDEMRRRQTRAVGLTSFISGYFAKAAVS
ncbi:8977_t:CDS:2 [Paraglomus brasilianum]|uniref:8977_t:CDS:1 n=1 Tax=Paraglomus brasilianum TaxID=144538 RepID=A0A9N9AAI8_9GLOM|nr:8977_t:CDS:2 [Paraglomus brasilianum]